MNVATSGRPQGLPGLTEVVINLLISWDGNPDFCRPGVSWASLSWEDWGSCYYLLNCQSRQRAFHVFRAETERLVTQLDDWNLASSNQGSDERFPNSKLSCHFFTCLKSSFGHITSNLNLKIPYSHPLTQADFCGL